MIWRTYGYLDVRKTIQVTSGGKKRERGRGRERERERGGEREKKRKENIGIMPAI